MEEKEIVLYPHNEKAYEKLNRTLETTNYCAINHATGTGKSFIMLKYLYNNRNKRILYLSPSYAINDQLVNEHLDELGISQTDFVKFDTMIYTTLLKGNMKDLASQYDIIILDEYQRCGAFEWGKKVKELMDVVKREGKICIGTSATPVRYLDRHRNMCDILFDGHIASELSVADAMIEGILPVPYYINYSISLVEQLAKLKKKILKNMPYDDMQSLYLNKVEELQYKLNSIGKEDQQIKDKIISDGKYLVFSNTISNMETDIRTIKKSFDIDTLSYYKVSSVNSHKVNNDIIREFRNIKNNNPTFLLSVNIANEGLHIKGLDAIFLLRRTTSPIIYLQQLGRLLSFSKNKHQLYVFDLVNNVLNNQVVIDLYSELLSKAKDRIVIDPENRERYQKIINYFQIIDITGKLNAEIEELSQDLSRGKIIEMRLNRAIDILTLSQTDFNCDVIQAQLDIFKYQKYINREQFKKIQLLSIEKPSLFSNSYEEFDKYIGKYNSISEMIANRYKSKVQEIYQFYEDAYHLPRLFSEDANEKELATYMMTGFESFSDKVRSFIIKHVEDDFSPVEKLVYLSQSETVDSVSIYNDVSKLIEEGRPVSVEIVSFLVDQGETRSEELLERIRVKNQFNSSDFINPLISPFEDNAKIKEKYHINTDIIFKEGILLEIRDSMRNNQYSSKEDYLKNLFDKLADYIKAFGDLPLYKKREDIEQQLFLQYYVFYDELEKEGYIEKINELLKQSAELKRTKRKNLFLLNLMPFMDEHGGCLPCKDSYNSDEQQLANEYILFSDLFTDDDWSIIKEHQQGFELHKNIVIKKYVDFIKQKGRKPLLSNRNELEYNLAIDFLRIEPMLTEEEKIIIATATGKLNKYDEQKRLLREMLKEKGL